jgi:energy-coupling factor transporter ATP-binding protein EcfA2
MNHSPSIAADPASSPPAAPPAIDARDVWYRYPDGCEALRGISFTIARGESVALVGPNGAGKSTLLWHLNGLLPERGHRLDPVHSHGATTSASSNGKAGLVLIDGIDVNAKHGPEIRRRVGLLFQDPDDQLFSTSVLDDVAFGPLNQGKSKAEARRIAEDCLKRVELENVSDRMPHHLSFGERKRVCLAGVLACDPTVLVLDEPSANLDPRGRRRLMSLIGSLPATKLIATHDLELALELCCRAILLDSGQVVVDGVIRDVLSDPALLEAHGLEMPLSLRLR